MSSFKGYKLAGNSYSTEYKIGDVFTIEEGVHDGFSIGTRIALAEDDNSSCPRFVLEGCDLDTEVWKDYGYFHWSKLKPEHAKEELPFPVGTEVELLKSSDLIMGGQHIFLKGDICTIFGYTSVQGKSTPIIQDYRGCVTTYRKDLLKLPNNQDDKLKKTLEEYYSSSNLKQLVEDIKNGKVKGLKYIGEDGE
jgi:hypothetical protein